MFFFAWAYHDERTMASDLAAWDSCSRPSIFQDIITGPSDFLAVWKIPHSNFASRSVSTAEWWEQTLLNWAGGKWRCCAASNPPSEAMGFLLGLAGSAQSSLRIVTKAVLSRSQPRLLQESSTQAQDIAELSFSSFVIYTCLSSLCPLALHILFPKSPDSSSQGCGTWISNKRNTWRENSQLAASILSSND